MAKKRKGPREVVGLRCTECKHFNYVTEFNKVNEQLKKQATNKGTFPIRKYCKSCKKHTLHKLLKKLK